MFLRLEPLLLSAMPISHSISASLAGKLMGLIDYFGISSDGPVQLKDKNYVKTASESVFS